MAETITLDRADVKALLYALDDADAFFNGGERSQRMLVMWQRLNDACCYLDGEKGYHGDEQSRALTISPDEALDLWILCTPEWLRTVRPRAVQHRVAGILNRCCPSQEAHHYPVSRHG